MPKISFVTAGTIVPFAGIVPPFGYLLCNGAEVLRSEYPNLFKATSINFTSVSRNSTVTLTISSGQNPINLGVRAGMGLSGNGIPNGATVVSFTSTQIEMSVPASSTGIGSVDICFFGAGNGSTTFNLPDFRGRFLRGVDFTANRDPDKTERTAQNTNANTGNNVGSVQNHQLSSHRHLYSFRSGLTNFEFEPGPQGWTGTANANTAFTGGNETRPSNSYVNYIIKI